jgi:2,3-dihydroxybenzoate-AMP ligase
MLPSPEPAGAFAAIAAAGVTHTAVVPAVAGRWLEHAATCGSDELRSLRVLQVGGARIPDELARKVPPLLGAQLQQVFGMAEGRSARSRPSRCRIRSSANESASTWCRGRTRA